MQQVAKFAFANVCSEIKQIQVILPLVYMIDAKVSKKYLLFYYMLFYTRYDWAA